MGYSYPISTHNHIIIACCLLHNFIRQFISDPLENDFSVFVGVNDETGEDDDNNVINMIWALGCLDEFTNGSSNIMFNEWQSSI